MQANWDLGRSDAAQQNSSSSTAARVEDIFHWFALKLKHDKRVKEVTFDQFIDLKRRRTVFENEYSPLADEALTSLFLQ